MDESLSGRAKLRDLIASVDREVSRLTATATPGPTEGLAASWAALVGLLDVGPAPDLRACPVCGRAGMREATVCGYCWSKLSPPAGGTAAPPR